MMASPTQVVMVSWTVSSSHLTMRLAVQLCCWQPVLELPSGIAVAYQDNAPSVFLARLLGV